MKCTYAVCPIPDNNRIYIGQALYMGVSAIALINYPEKIEPLSIILLLFPPILDMLFTKLEPFLLNMFKWFLFLADAVLVFFSVLGQAALVEYSEGKFQIPKGAALLPGVSFLNMQIVAIILIANFIPPILFYFGRPCKKNQDHVAEQEALKNN